MFYKIVRVIFVLVSGLLMLRFAFPKLTANPVSQETFELLSQFVPLNTNLLMYFTGAVELLVGLLLITSLLIKNLQLKTKFQILGYFLLLSTMIGGLLTEFLARPEPKMLLVIIAIVLIIISLLELSVLTKKKKEI